MNKNCLFHVTIFKEINVKPKLNKILFQILNETTVIQSFSMPDL